VDVGGDEVSMTIDRSTIWRCPESSDAIRGLARERRFYRLQELL
jgi:hypothetical protein